MQNTVKPSLSKKDPQYFGAWIYTVEFSGLLPVPVYINMQIADNAESNSDIAELGSFFEENSDRAVENSNIKFIVNPDYGISLP
ncbi:MAG: hypothetical protein EHM45_23870 [Desulfobacteraceae bacterium]|nr:MAG: hypothetical protein EHM45_23870 [Desulfobacteraceae bacterium]